MARSHFGGSKLDDSAFERGGDGVSSVVDVKLCEDICDVAFHTVSSAMKSLPAISLFALPAAINRSTSISRKDRSSCAVCSANSIAISGGIRIRPEVNGADDLRQISIYLTL